MSREKHGSRQQKITENNWQGRTIFFIVLGIMGRAKRKEETDRRTSLWRMIELFGAIEVADGVGLPRAEGMRTAAAAGMGRVVALRSGAGRELGPWAAEYEHSQVEQSSHWLLLDTLLLIGTGVS